MSGRRHHRHCTPKLASFRSSARSPGERRQRQAQARAGGGGSAAAGTTASPPDDHPARAWWQRALGTILNPKVGSHACEQVLTAIQHEVAAFYGGSGGCLPTPAQVLRLGALLRSPRLRRDSNLFPSFEGSPTDQMMVELHGALGLRGGEAFALRLARRDPYRSPFAVLKVRGSGGARGTIQCARTQRAHTQHAHPHLHARTHTFTNLARRPCPRCARQVLELEARSEDLPTFHGVYHAYEQRAVPGAMSHLLAILTHTLDPDTLVDALRCLTGAVQQRLSLLCLPMVWDTRSFARHAWMEPGGGRGVALRCLTHVVVATRDPSPQLLEAAATAIGAVAGWVEGGGGYQAGLDVVEWDPVVRWLGDAGVRLMGRTQGTSTHRRSTIATSKPLMAVLDALLTVLKRGDWASQTSPWARLGWQVVLPLCHRMYDRRDEVRETRVPCPSPLTPHHHPSGYPPPTPAPACIPGCPLPHFPQMGCVCPSSTCGWVRLAVAREGSSLPPLLRLHHAHVRPVHRP
jgi:hypothetical protein